MSKKLVLLIAIAIWLGMSAGNAFGDEEEVTCNSDEILVYFTDNGSQCVKRQIQPQTPTPQISTTVDSNDDGQAD